MNRRQALQMMAVVGGGTFIGMDLFLKGCKANGNKALNFSPEMINFLDQVGETIIPTTKTKGAKAAQIGVFMKTIVSDCYTEDQQQIFMKGVEEIQEYCQKKFNANFLKITAEQQHQFLTELDTQAKQLTTEKKHDKKNPHYFTLIKQLTIWGFFTSEIGQTEVYDYHPVPGKFDGAAKYKKGERAFL